MGNEGADTAVAIPEELAALVRDPKAGLVFWVGAGATAPELRVDPLLRALVQEAARHGEVTQPAAQQHPIQFELVLNDLWQICPEAVGSFYESLRTVPATPTAFQAFLSRWLLRGGTVVTTNYDCLTEQAAGARASSLRVRYDSGATSGERGFAAWREDLAAGGVLFKLHGSLADPASCLGALAHVSTHLRGARADLVTAVIRERPVCFVGWAGGDPDLPPVVAAAALATSTARLYWAQRTAQSAPRSPAIIHLKALKTFHGGDQATLARAFDPSGKLARTRPGGNRSGPALVADLSTCTRSGAARFIAIHARRDGRHEDALRALEVAGVAALAEELAAREERALVLWSRNQPGDQERAWQIVREVAIRASRAHLRSAFTSSFGLLSMTIVRARHRPWRLLAVPRLLEEHRQRIEELTLAGDHPGAHLQLALLELYRGTLRRNIAGWLPWRPGWIKRWVLAPFVNGRRALTEADDRSLHGRFDVLAGYALASATAGNAAAAIGVLADLDRLAAMLSDWDRYQHWELQRGWIEAAIANGG